MTLEERLAATEQQFAQLQQEQQALLKGAEEIGVELVKLQGEHRLLKKMIEERNAEESSAQDAQGNAT